MTEYAVVRGGIVGIRNPNTDPIENGGYSIKGRVSEKNTPIPCRVRLFEKLSGRLIADVLTDNTGYYAFDHLTETKFFIVAHHPKLKFNTVIQDNVVLK